MSQSTTNVFSAHHHALLAWSHKLHAHRALAGSYMEPHVLPVVQQDTLSLMGDA